MGYCYNGKSDSMIKWDKWIIRQIYFRVHDFFHICLEDVVETMALKQLYKMHIIYFTYTFDKNLDKVKKFLIIYWFGIEYRMISGRQSLV